MKKQFLYMDTAYVWKRGSTCTRLKVGAIIVNEKTGRVISTGYNGTIRNFVNCEDIFIFKDSEFFIHENIKDYLEPNDTWDFAFPKELDGKKYFQVNEDTWKKLHHDFSELYEVHGEMNAILNMFKDGTQTKMDDAVIYVTTAPCKNCCKLIASTGIKKVYYSEAYDRFGIEEIDKLCKTLGIELIHIE